MTTSVKTSKIKSNQANKIKYKIPLSEHFQNPIGKIIERGKIDTPIIQIHDRSLSCLGTDRSIKSGGGKLIIWTSILYFMNHVKDYSLLNNNTIRPIMM
jgi:hypothetical protein